MIRAIFFDLDGTLLNAEKRIPESARKAILRCRAKGIRAYFATARSPRLDKTLKWTADDFALFDGEIYSNGACVHLGGEEKHCFIEREAVRRCMDAVQAFEGVHLSLHMPREGYAFNFQPDESMDEGWGLQGARICCIDEDAIRCTLKILLFYDHLIDAQEKLPEALYARLLQDCGGLANVYLTDEGRTIQLSGLEAGKLKAIERIRLDRGWQKEEVAGWSFFML